MLVKFYRKNEEKSSLTCQLGKAWYNVTIYVTILSKIIGKE